MGKKELIQLFGEHKVRMKQRLKDEGNETVTNCHQLKMMAADGSAASE